MKFGLPIFRHHSDDLILGRTSPFSFFPSFRIRAWQRANHMYVLGITGQGKSKLLQHCILQDILAIDRRSRHARAVTMKAWPQRFQTILEFLRVHVWRPMALSRPVPPGIGHQCR